MREDGRNLSLNPQTGEFEYLTPREWHLVKHGYLRSTPENEIDAWHLHALDGAEIAVTWAFDLDREKDKGTIIFLVGLFNEWPTPIDSGVMLYNWRDFILDIYNFDAKRDFLNKLYTIQVQFQRAAWERREAERELKEYTTKKATKIYEELQRLKRKKRRAKER